MTFAAPLFLLAALAAAIPVVLHMVQRRRAKDLPFPTLRFLRLSAQKTRRRKRIHDAMLMLLRAAVLLLLAAGLARPTVTRLGGLWGNAQTAAVIVLDNSASMGHHDGDRPRFETATAAAGQILDQLAEGDQVAVLPTCGPPFADAGRLHRNQDAVRQILRQCGVSYERASLSRKLQEARELLAKSEAPNKQIYIVTDMQRGSWEEKGKGNCERGKGEGGRGTSRSRYRPVQAHGLQRVGSAPRIIDAASPFPFPLPPSFPIILIDCNRAPKPNVAVEAVDLEAAIPMPGVPLKAAVTLRNMATVAQSRMVELLIDGVKEASSPELTLPPLGRAKHEFTFTLKQGGLHRGLLHLVGEDGSKYDDRRFFCVEAGEGMPVAVVKPERHEIPYLDDGYYLEHALAAGGASGGAIRATVLLPADLAAEPLEKYRVIFCVNLPALRPDAAARLAASLAGGGNLVWICGDNVNVEAYNRMNQEAGGQLLPAPLVDLRVPNPQDKRDSWHVSFLDKQHPALVRLAEPASLYESVLVYKHFRMAADPQARVLARLDDGEPLLIQRSTGRGQDADVGHQRPGTLVEPAAAADLPAAGHTAYVRPGRAGAGQLQSDRRPAAGAAACSPAALGWAGRGRGDPAGRRNPAAHGRHKAATSGRGRGATTGRGFVPEFRYDDTHEIGVYLLRPVGAAAAGQTAYSVNFDPDEADPAKIERRELEGLLDGAPLVVAENPDDLSAVFAQLREGKSLWGAFLAAVLVVLVFETFVSNRISGKAATSGK